MTRSAGVRLLLGLAAVALWFGVGAPVAADAIGALKAGRAMPPAAGAVRTRLALLPAGSQATPVVGRLRTALDRDDALAAAEATWNRSVGGLLSAEQRAAAAGLADLGAPPPPPPLEAPEADGDLVLLARALLDRYGYAEVAADPPPLRDPWLGVDRRTRARGILALVKGPGLEPDVGRAILAATLAFLDAQLERAENGRRIAELLPVAMGER